MYMNIMVPVNNNIVMQKRNKGKQVELIIYVYIHTNQSNSVATLIVQC